MEREKESTSLLGCKSTVSTFIKTLGLPLEVVTNITAKHEVHHDVAVVFVLERTVLSYRWRRLRVVER